MSCKKSTFFPLFFFIAVAVGLSACNGSNNNNKNEKASAFFPIGPKELIDIYDSIVSDTLYIQHHFASDSLKLLTKVYISAEEAIDFENGYFHQVWADNAELDEELYPEIIVFTPHSENAYAVSVICYSEEPDVSLVVFNNKDKERMVELIKEEGFADEKCDTIFDDEGKVNDILGPFFCKVVNGKEMCFEINEKPDSQYNISYRLFQDN